MGLLQLVFSCWSQPPHCFREGLTALLCCPSLPGGLASTACQNKPSKKNQQTTRNFQPENLHNLFTGKSMALEAQVSRVLHWPRGTWRTLGFAGEGAVARPTCA